MLTSKHGSKYGLYWRLTGADIVWCHVKGSTHSPFLANPPPQCEARNTKLNRRFIHFLRELVVLQGPGSDTNWTIWGVRVGVKFAYFRA